MKPLTFCRHREELDDDTKAHYLAHPEMICAQCWDVERKLDDACVLGLVMIDPLYQVPGALPVLARVMRVRMGAL